MKERPILFSAPMVRAILDGSKTQTRRVMKVQPPGEGFQMTTCVSTTGDRREVGKHRWAQVIGNNINEAGDYFSCPYGYTGDLLWVRESLRFVAVGDNRHEHAVYAADGVRVRRCPDLADWACDGLAFNCARSVPSIHMPRWASRILLEVTGVRVERLQDISETDSWAEGISTTDAARYDAEEPSARGAYKNLWEQINGAGSWDANPRVWVVEFKRID